MVAGHSSYNKLNQFLVDVICSCNYQWKGRKKTEMDFKETDFLNSLQEEKEKPLSS